MRHTQLLPFCPIELRSFLVFFFFPWIRRNLIRKIQFHLKNKKLYKIIIERIRKKINLLTLDEGNNFLKSDFLIQLVNFFFFIGSSMKSFQYQHKKNLLQNLKWRIAPFVRVWKKECFKSGYKWTQRKEVLPFLTTYLRISGL